MRHVLVLVLALLAAPAACLSVASLLGVGVVRHGAPGVLAVVALAVTLLPPMAAASLVQRDRAAAILAALLPWALGVVAVFPLYFPGERLDALTTGLVVVGAPPSVASAVAQAEPLLPAFQGARPPAPQATPVDRPTSGDGTSPIELTAESHGRSVTVGIRAAGPRGQQDLKMLFDTGASLTTLSQKKLDELGVVVEKNGPTVKLRTAGGEISTQLAIVDRLILSGVEVPGVTVAVCEACADDQVSGLLGLNVSSLFLVNLDTANDRVILEQRGVEANRILDIAPWLEVRATATSWLDGRVEVQVEVKNNSHRSVGLADVAIRCSSSYIASLHDVPRHGTATTTVALPRQANCETYTAPLERALW